MGRTWHAPTAGETRWTDATRASRSARANRPEPVGPVARAPVCAHGDRARPAAASGAVPTALATRAGIDLRRIARAVRWGIVPPEEVMMPTGGNPAWEAEHMPDTWHTPQMEVVVGTVTLDDVRVSRLAVAEPEEPEIGGDEPEVREDGPDARGEAPQARGCACADSGAEGLVLLPLGLVRRRRRESRRESRRPAVPSRVTLWKRRRNRINARRRALTPAGAGW